MRACERCGEGMAPGRPRVRVGGKQLWCQTCAKDIDSPSGRYRPGTDIATHSLLEADMNTKIALTATLTNQRIIVVAHDSGDGQTIYHCPFCGSGQVLARSDRTIECEFCHTSFTVQVQPEYSAFPQTDPQTGLPIQVPGMPGQIDQPVGAPGADPNADPAAAGQDPTAAGQATGQDANQDGVDDGFEAGAPASAGNQPPWLKGARLFHTASGQALDPADYIRHLAIKHADDRSAVVMQVRATRRAT